MVPTDENPESDFILEWSDFSAVSERVNSDIFTSVYCCLNHAVMQSALRVFSQLFVYFLFKFFMLCLFQITYCTVIIIVHQKNALEVIFVNN